MTSYIFVLCEPGAKMTTEIEKIGEEIERCEWYLLSVEMRRMYLIFLADTQSEVKLSGYGGITCDRETSKRVFTTNRNTFTLFTHISTVFLFHLQVLNKAFSYYMTFRNFKPT